MAKLNIIQIVPYIGDEASGPAYSVPALCSALQRNGCQVTLYTLKPLPKKDFNFTIKGYTRSTFPTYSFGRSKEMYKKLMEDSLGADIIHNHSFWMAPNIYAGLVARSNNIPLMNSPRGTMSKEALGRSKINKWISLRLGQALSLKTTNCFHATALHEVDDIKKQFPNKRISLIPNGVDVPELQKKVGSNRGKNKLLFLGRLHSIKGIENLILAWAKLEKKFSNWELEIVGVGDKKYVDTLKQLIKLNKLNRVVISEALYGSEKVSAFQNADLYVLPSFSENFGMTVAEALANNTAVITTNGTPWNNLDNRKAGWCIDVGVEPLEKALTVALSKSRKELFEIGSNGRDWMIKDFSWDSIARDMIATYKWVLNQGDKPKFVK